MARRAVPALLALSAFLADVAGAHAFAVLVLFVAIPATFALVVSCYGDAVEQATGLGRAVVAGLGLFLLVFSAALRSPALVGGVPRVAITALAFAPLPCLYAGVRRVRARPVVTQTAVADERQDLVDAA